MIFKSAVFLFFFMFNAPQAGAFEQDFGFRLQAIAQEAQSEELSSQDMFFRRSRLEYAARFEQKYSFHMDVRSDRVNQADRGEGGFKIGDAYVQRKLSSRLKLRYGRAKVDVSRTQTISSADLLHPNRASVANFAADHISQARRAVNAQILHNPTPWLAYQIYAGDGVESDSFDSGLAQGSVEKIVSQNFTLGAKVRFYPLEGWRFKELNETYFGKEKHFSFGFGAGAGQEVKLLTSSGARETINPSIQNFEVSAHAERFGFQAEWFSFSDVVQDFDQLNLELGKGEGGYAQGELLLFQGQWAPFIRYELWDRFIDPKDHVQKGYLAGINYYPKRGEELRYGASFEQANYGEDLEEFFGEQDSLYSVYIMLHY